MNFKNLKKIKIDKKLSYLEFARYFQNTQTKNPNIKKIENPWVLRCIC